MSNNKDPAFLFYTSDFLTGTMLFTDKQVGQYIRLLCLQHQKGHLTEADIKKVCKGKDTDILAKFKQDEQGLYYNSRLEIEAEKREKFIQHQRENIQKRWDKKAGKQDTERIPTEYHGNTTVIPLENENEIVNKDIKKSKEKGTGKTSEKEEEPPFNWTDYTSDISLLDAFNGFDEMRNKAKKPLTARAKKLQCSTLDELTSDLQTKIAIVNQSVMNGWSSLYALKNGGCQKKETRNSQGIDEADEIREAIRRKNAGSI